MAPKTTSTLTTQKTTCATIPVPMPKDFREVHQDFPYSPAAFIVGVVFCLAPILVIDLCLSCFVQGDAATIFTHPNAVGIQLTLVHLGLIAIAIWIVINQRRVAKKFRSLTWSFKQQVTCPVKVQLRSSQASSSKFGLGSLQILGDTTVIGYIDYISDPDAYWLIRDNDDVMDGTAYLDPSDQKIIMVEIVDLRYWISRIQSA